MLCDPRSRLTNAQDKRLRSGDGSDAGPEVSEGLLMAHRVRRQNQSVVRWFVMVSPTIHHTKGAARCLDWFRTPSTASASTHGRHLHWTLRPKRPRDQSPLIKLGQWALGTTLPLKPPMDYADARRRAVGARNSRAGRFK